MKRDIYLVRVGIFSAVFCASLVVFYRYGVVNMFVVALPATFMSLAVVWVTDNFFWRMDKIKNIFGNIPDLNGQWVITVNKIGDEHSHQMQATVRQKWSSISIEFDGDRVLSRSTVALLNYEKGQYNLDYMWEGIFKPEYSNHGKLTGAASLQLNRELFNLYGTYWTHANENSTIGVMTFKKKDNT